ncbi:fumarylacetoacetate hydrolase family protein [Paenibacillus sp. 1P07SE]|uniref:fumarylacetoacetate hydrolase family protein n=1 Tax=Paenibacillus sp. 1P07SE TaxID=3132209 RepID=UPI0039A538E5
MKLLNYIEHGVSKLGVLTEDGVLDIGAAANKTGTNATGVPVTMQAVLDGGDGALAKLQGLVAQAAAASESSYFRKEDELTFGPSLGLPEKIICVGLNYRRHAEETNMPIPAYPILFNKFANTLTGHGAAVPLPRTSRKVDYEAELGIVIGKEAKYVSEGEALDYVFGYCAVNDLSARDLQMRTSQWLAGKSCDGFSPVGPYLVTADEIADPDNLRIGCSVNGEVRQDSNTSDMIFNCRQLISDISSCMTLKPGDIILTGTPEGVVLGYPEEQQHFLQPGDVVTVTIEGLGTIRNSMMSEEGAG